MKIAMIILMCIVSNVRAIAQEEIQKINFIIETDEKLITGNVSMKILAVLENGEKKDIKVVYYPGDIIISKQDYSFLLNDKVKSVTMSIWYTDFSNKKNKDYAYNIHLPKHWLTDSFYILYIYNMYNPKYKKLFVPMEGRDYVYETDSSEGWTRRERKK